MRDPVPSRLAGLDSTTQRAATFAKTVVAVGTGGAQPLGGVPRRREHRQAAADTQRNDENDRAPLSA